MDRIGLSKWIVLVTFIFSHLPNSLATDLPEGDRSVISSLLSKFELKLQEAAFEYLERRDSPKSRRKNVNVGGNRKKRDAADRTAFIPRLHNHREQLVIDTINATTISWDDKCHDSEVVRFDSAYYHRKYYAFSICDDSLSLYEVEGPKLTMLERHLLETEALALSHVKLLDQFRGHVELFVLVLTTTSIDVFALENDHLEPIRSQSLSYHSSPTVSVFYMQGSVYYMLGKAESNGLTRIGIFELQLNNTILNFELVSIRTLYNSSMVRMCVGEDDRGYLFIAKKGRHRLDIYQYDSKKLEHHQVIDTSSEVDDISCFRMGVTHYATVVTSGTLRIFQQVDTVYELIEFETVLPGLVSVLPLPTETYRDEVILLAQGVEPEFNERIVDLLTFDPKSSKYTSKIGSTTCERPVDDWESVDVRSYVAPTEGLSCIARDTIPDWSSLSAGLILDHNPSLIVLLDVNGNKKPVVISLGAHLEAVDNPVLQQKEKIRQKVEEYDAALKAIANRSGQFEAILPKLILSGSDVKLHGTAWKVGTLRVGNLTIPEAEARLSRKVEFNREEWQSFIDVTIGDVVNQVEQLARLIESIEKQMEGAVMNGTEDAVNLRELLVNGSAVIQSLKADNLFLNHVNGQPINSTLNDTVRRDSDRLIEGLKTLNGMLKTTALTANKINGIPINNIVSTDRLAHIDGNVKVAGPAKIEGDLTAAGKVADVDLDQLLTASDHYPSLRFTEPIRVDKLIISGRINGLVGNEEFFDSILVDGSTDLEMSSAEFEDLVVRGDVNVVSGNICGSTPSVLKNVVRVDTDDHIPVNIKMTGGVIIEKSLDAKSINNLKIPEDLVYRDQNTTLTSHKSFHGNVEVGSMVVKGMVNDRRIQEAVTLDTDQEVDGTIVLGQGFEVKRNLNVTQVNGNVYDTLLSVGVHPTLLLRPTNRTVFFKKPVRMSGTLEVGSTVNGVPLKDAINDILYLDEKDPVVNGQKTLNSLKLGNLEISGLVNDTNVMEDLLTKSTNQSIHGEYRFGGLVEMETLNVSNLNEYDIDDLIGSLVRLDGDQDIGSQLQFADLVVDNELEVNGSINGIPVNRMLTAKNEQNFTAQQILVDPQFVYLKIAGNLSLEGAKVNGIELNKLDQRRFTLSTDQNITQEWQIDQVGFKNAKFDSLNQQPMNHWTDAFVRTRVEDQAIQGNVGVSNLKVGGNVMTKGGLNGFPRLDEIIENAYDTRMNISLSGEVHFERLESTGNTVVQNVNDVDLQSLKEDAVFVKNPKPINGTKTFHRSIAVAENLDSPNINGGQLVDLYLHSTMDQLIESPIHFNAPVSTQEVRLVETATFNGLRSDSLFSSEALPDNIHHGNATFTNKINVSDLITTKINGEDWAQLTSSLAWTNQTNRFLHQVKIDNLKVNGAIETEDINGIDFNKWADDVVFSDVDATISGPKHFEDIVVPKLATNSVQSSNVFPNLTKLMEGAIHLIGDETIDFDVIFNEVEVTGDMKINGLLNGHAFPNDYVTLKGQQNLTGEYSIKQLVANGQIGLAEGGIVNGLNLTSEFNDTWMLDRPTHLEWQITFSGPVEADSNFDIARTVNGMDLSNEAVPLQNDSVIYGTPIFRELSVGGDIENVGMTNDVNLSALASRALYIDEPIVTSGNWKIGNMKVEGEEFLLTKAAQVNGHDVENLVNLPESEVEEEEELVKDRRLFDLAKNWYDALRSAYFKLNYFEVNQSIDVRFPITSMLNIVLDESTSVLLVGTQYCSSVIYSKNEMDSTYEYAGIISQTNSAFKWILLQVKDSVAYVASLSKMTPFCRQNNAKLWKIGKDPIRMELIQDLGRNVVDVASSSLSNDVQLVFTAGEVLKQWTISNRNPAQISSRVLSNSSSINILSIENQNGVRFSSSDQRTHRFNVGEDQLVAVMEPKESSVSGCSGVKIHRYHNNQHLLEHVIPACGVQEMITFTLGNLPDHFIVLAERSWVGVYQYRGSSGFVRKTTLPIPSARSLQWIRRGNDYFLAVGKQGTIVIYKAITLGHFVDS